MIAARTAQPSHRSPSAIHHRGDLVAETKHYPTEIKLHKKSRTLEVAFDDGKAFTFTHEFLRVHSPSAEVQGHGPGQEVLQVGKESVDIETLEQVGNYAIQINFDDGHNTGIYAWDTLYRYGENRDAMWQSYLARLEAAGEKRDPNRPKEAKPKPLIGD
jgi:DUF971 family protein